MTSRDAAQSLPGERAVITDDRRTLDKPLARTLGARTAQALEKLGLTSIGDLLLHAPRKLARRGQLLPLGSVTDGDAVTVVARVESANLRPMNARRGFLLNVLISDGANSLSLTFFGKSSRILEYHQKRLRPGTLGTFGGTVSTYRGQLQLSHPEYEILDDLDEVDEEKIARPIPIYPAAAKMPSWKIATAVETILSALEPEDVPDILPATYIQEHKLPNRYDAITSLHAPESDAEWDAAKLHFAHEEAFLIQTVLARRAAATAQEHALARPRKPGGLLDAFDQRLPFALTSGQLEVGEQICGDLGAEAPMQRLLQGDVGSGKTIVALRAMLQVVDAGGQAALLAPTEVLAHQHAATIESLLGPLAQAGTLHADPDLPATRIDLLTGSMSTPAKRSALARIGSGEAGIVVGTHALLSDNVQIPFLSLAVVDEQHRFGVNQRDTLRRHGEGAVHLLVMTATPIPRTIAMSAFGDLEVSSLTELPAGRGDVTTTVVPAANEVWVARVWERVREEVDAGGHAYIVCPRISADTSDDDGEPLETLLDLAEDVPLASVEAVSAELAANPVLAGIPIGVMHGQLPPEEKSSAMAAFASGNVPILVSTTVIEVGVDVPDATAMVILDAERFGLSQLHQLRGRIGRASKPGVCLAITRAHPASLARERLEAFAATRDGFVLAEKDLELRREGDVLGATQSGTTSSLRFLRVTKDADVIAAARAGARAVVGNDPNLDGYPELAAAAAALDETESADYLDRG